MCPYIRFCRCYTIFRMLHGYNVFLYDFEVRLRMRICNPKWLSKMYFYFILDLYKWCFLILKYLSNNLVERRSYTMTVSSLFESDSSLQCIWLCLHILNVCTWSDSIWVISSLTIRKCLPSYVDIKVTYHLKVIF